MKAGCASDDQCQHYLGANTACCLQTLCNKSATVHSALSAVGPRGVTRKGHSQFTIKTFCMVHSQGPRQQFYRFHHTRSEEEGGR